MTIEHSNTTPSYVSQLRAMRSQQFELLLIRTAEDGRVDASMKTLSLAELQGRGSYLRAQNAHGSNVNIRPVNNHLSLIDDITEETVRELFKTGYEPCVVTETSPRNFQAWLDHGRELTPTEATDFARQLAVIADADLGAAGRRHAGRLAGFTNRKPAHRRDDGKYPFVRLHYAWSRTFSKATSLRATDPVPQPARVNGAYTLSNRTRLRTIEDFRVDPRYEGDGSRSDYAYAIYGLSHGLSQQRIVEDILTRDMSKKGGAIAQKRYATYTVKRAARHV